jgi:protein PhnA
LAPAGDGYVVVRDSNGNELSDGDTVQVIKDLKVKGSSQTLKRGTVFKGIHLTDDEEAVECGQGRNTLVLKSCFLKKA